MILKVNGEYRINTDQYCWKVERYSGISKDGVEIWRPVGYYTSLEGAGEGLFQRMIRLSDAEGFDEAVKEIKRAKEEILKALEIPF